MPTVSAFCYSTNMCSHYWQLGYTNLCKATTALITCFAIQEFIRSSQLAIFQLQYKLRCSTSSVVRATSIRQECDCVLLFHSRATLTCVSKVEVHCELRLKVQVSIYWTTFKAEKMNPSTGEIWLAGSLKSVCNQSAKTLLLMRDEVTWEFKRKVDLLRKSIAFMFHVALLWRTDKKMTYGSSDSWI
jgi:hypothetical protein